MGTLEPGFQRLHWPPLVKEIEHTKDYPGYRYKYFTSFQELNSYFSDLCGHNWREQEWAKYWINQHLETKNDDRKAFISPAPDSSKGGPRRDIKMIRELVHTYYNINPKMSSYKIARHIAHEQGITVSHQTVWSILKKLRSNGN